MRICRIATAVLALFACDLLPSAAQAKVLGPLEVEALAGMGGPIALVGASYPGGVSTAPFTLVLAGRLGFPDYSPLQLEVNAVIPHGLGVNLLLNVVQIRSFRLHLLDPGIFWNLGQPVSAARIPRPYDFTIGAGASYQVWKTLAVNLDWRWFIPNPLTVIPDYDGFSYPAYREALRGGQLWLSASYTW